VGRSIFGVFPIKNSAINELKGLLNEESFF
jgi:hypothetical protein